jgi:hypothetical protein
VPSPPMTAILCVLDMIFAALRLVDFGFLILTESNSVM